MNGVPTKVVLGGALAQECKSAEWDLFVSSPAEAMQAIDVNTGGRFMRHLREKGGYYHIAIGREDNCLADGRELVQPSGHQTIYIMPEVAGEKSPWAKIIAAVIIAIITYGAATYFEAAGWSAQAVQTLEVVGYSTAASLAIQGVVQLVTPVPNFNNTSATATKSDVFGGNATAISQGGAVPLVYGRMRVPALPISLAFVAQDQSAVNSFASTQYVITDHGGGIISYTPVTVEPVQDLPPPDEPLP